MSKEKIYEIGFDDKCMGDHKGEWDAWFLSDLICLVGGNVSCTAKDYVEVDTDDYKKRICVYIDLMKFVCYVGDKHEYSAKDHLAFQGFCTKYNLKYEEWCDESN